jgi:flagellar biosynthesis protein
MADEKNRAVGLHYSEEDDSAPKVIAKGEGLVADRMLELAREHGIPVREDPDLLQLLSAADVGQEIPAEVYTAVAQVLTYLYGLNSELGK